MSSTRNTITSTGATTQNRRRVGATLGGLALLGGLSGLAPGPSAQAASPNLFARVDASGGLIAGPSGTSVTKLGTGQFEVGFEGDVSSCAYVATTRNASSQAVQAYTAGGHLGRNGVYVEVKNQGGGLSDAPFDVAAFCGNPATSYAVVGYDANLVRSTSGASLNVLGSGRYEVAFPTTVRGCAFLATVGDPANDLVFNPAGVATSRRRANSVYVETKNPGGGLQDGVPFHLAVVCPGASSIASVVTASDGLARRGSPLTSSYRASTGNDVVVTPRDLTACATIATRGQSDSSVPFAPATVEITDGPAPNTAGIQVRSLLFFGGDLLDEAFHAATIC